MELDKIKTYFHVVFADMGKDETFCYGFEPEYEDSTIVAENFDSFITKIISGEIVL